MDKEAVTKREAVIDVLNKRENDLKSQLSVINSEIRAELILLANEKYGVKPGVIVQNRKGDRFKVVDVDVRHDGSRPWLTGHATKKDGSFGMSVRHLYSDWSVEGFDHE